MKTNSLHVRLQQRLHKLTTTSVRSLHSTSHNSTSPCSSISHHAIAPLAAISARNASNSSNSNTSPSNPNNPNNIANTCNSPKNSSESAADASNDNLSLGFWDGLAARHGEHSIYAPEGYNRWQIVPLAVSSHLCLGACYAWSIFNEPLTRELGVLAQASNDWHLSNVVTTFMAIIVCQGGAMAICGKWVEKVGARITGVTGSLLYGGGMIVGAGGVYLHSLPLMIAGYGVIAGSGMGLAYLPPVAALLRWFPDRRGLATGMGICGFGGGAIFIASIKKNLLQRFFEAPEFVGTFGDVETKRDAGGRLLANVGKITDNSGNITNSGTWEEVLNVTNEEMANIGIDGLQEGLYLVGTGNTGVAATMGSLGLGYLAICATSAALLKVPVPGWKPEAMLEAERVAAEEAARKAALGEVSEEASDESSDGVTTFVEIDDAVRTPQFWLLWTTFLSTATAGMGLMSCAKDVLAACFASSPAALAVGPTAFAATYVQALSAANLGGRFIWASASDKLGRKNTFATFGLLGAPLCFALPYIVSSALNVEVSNGPLILFYGSSMLIISFFGGGYSTIPAYESDFFGTKYISAIHGRMFTASALSGLSGPYIFSKWHALEEHKAIRNLTEMADVNKFIEKFGVGKDNIDALIENKTVNIAKLLEMCPDGTIDPTPYLYDPAFKTMGVVMGVGALANLAVGPVDPKFIKQAN